MITRLALDGYGARRVGSFAGKPATADTGRTIGVITRLSLDGYGARRVGAFAGKAGSGAVAAVSAFRPHIRVRRR